MMYILRNFPLQKSLLLVFYLERKVSGASIKKLCPYFCRPFINRELNRPQKKKTWLAIKLDFCPFSYVRTPAFKTVGVSKVQGYSKKSFKGAQLRLALK